jgi:hypothetical protein
MKSTFFNFFMLEEETSLTWLLLFEVSSHHWKLHWNVYSWIMEQEVGNPLLLLLIL